MDAFLAMNVDDISDKGDRIFMKSSHLLVIALVVLDNDGCHL